MAVRRQPPFSPTAFAAAVILVLLPAVAEAEEYMLTLDNRMEADKVELGCHEYNNWYVHPFQTAVMFFTDQIGRRPPHIACRWAYDGNFMTGVTVFDPRWPEAQACKRRNGGCRIVFENEEMFIVTRTALRLLGDLPVKRCKRHILFFSVGCHYPPHTHRYVGTILKTYIDFLNN